MDKRDQLLNIMEDAAKGETKAALRKEIAALKAENERLAKQRKDEIDRLHALAKRAGGARDVIMDCGPVGCCVIAPEKADEILEALTAAGYRILGLDEVDLVTVERCAEVARQYISDVGFPQPYATKAAAAIRTLASGGE